MAGILVYALHDDEGEFNKNSLGALSEAAKLAGELGTEAAAVVVGDVADDAAAGLGAWGVKKVYRCKEAPEGLAQPIVDVMAKVMQDNDFSYALFGGGLLGFEIGAGLTARLNAGVTMEVTRVNVQDGKLVAERPILQDSQIVHVGYVEEPGIIIGRLNAFDENESGGTAEVEDVQVELSEWSTKAKMVTRGEQRGADVNIEDADILVGAAAARQEENFELAEGSRLDGRRRGGHPAVVDAGWYPTPRRSVRPARPWREPLPGARHLGAIQHKVGMQSSRTSWPSTRTRTLRSSSSATLAWWGTSTRSSQAHRGDQGEEGQLMPVEPAEFPPPVKPAEEFIAPITDPEEERIEVGVAIVGGGPAGLACAIKVMQLLEDEPELTEKLGEVPVAVIEKGKTTGAHLLSGANMRPSAMRELFPDLDPSDWPVFQEVTKDAVYFLTSKMAVPLKPMPPNFRNHGNYVTSIAKLGRFLGEKAEEAGVYILGETAGDKLLVEDRIVRASAPATRDAARTARSSRTSSRARCGREGDRAHEGTFSHLTGAALDYFDLSGPDAQRWELGVKEIWRSKPSTA
jgi:electron transfer flavoprotein alpha subunit